MVTVTVSGADKEGARCVSSIQEKQVDKGASSKGCGGTRMGGRLGEGSQQQTVLRLGTQTLSLQVKVTSGNSC